MHIPDGFLSPPVWITLDAIAIPCVAGIARHAQRTFHDSEAPLLGVLGAFIFAAQMINFPVAIGTSGHLVGCALLAFTVGPAAASIVMAAILILQALLFQDGGVLALGANVTNMALAGVFAAYLPIRILSPRYRYVAYFTGAVLSLMISAILALSELLLSGVRMPGAIFSASLAFFGVSALIEGVITVAVIRSLASLNPQFIKASGAERRVTSSVLLLAALVLVTVGILIASAQPDGILSLAHHIGLESRAHPALAAPLPNYRVPLIAQSWISHALAGIAGLVLIYAICLLIGRLVLRRRIQAPKGA